MELQAGRTGGGDEPLNISILQGASFPVPPLRGGAIEKMWHRMGIEFAARGHAVTHVSRLCDGLPRGERRDGVLHVRVAGYDQPGNGLWLKILDLAYSLRAVRRIPVSDVVVTNTFWSPLLLGRSRGALCVNVERMPKGQMRLYRGAARLRASSSAVREAIVREDPAAAGRVSVIPNPLPFVPDAPVRWEEKTRTILYAGRLHPEKGIGLLLEAFVRARASGALEGWKLELVGPSERGRGGGGTAWMDALRARHRHPDIAWLPPRFDPDDLNRLYARAAVFAYPSQAERGETFGMAVLEAMAWGAAPVVSGLAVFRDFVDSGRNGIAFDHRCADPVGALAGALALAAERARPLGEAALEVRRTHAPGAIAERFLADFETLHAAASR